MHPVQGKGPRHHGNILKDYNAERSSVSAESEASAIEINPPVDIDSHCYTKIN